ncbi:uncharacterized protein LOC132265067 isoform X2 [Phlebotomus argentipes]|uniref:uncharacterized protein LOC132265067 isoform X2 n=1 Tax=Phlebotomus argentipes TaxID=94469 RepID=UPI0028937B33|nr:uncharacterized protein LOC132265067 isoform X2 [Phlebotomus argentipes]
MSCKCYAKNVCSVNEVYQEYVVRIDVVICTSCDPEEVVMRRRENFDHRQICAVALATFALIVSTCGDNVTDLASSHPMDGGWLELESGVTDRASWDDLTPVASELAQTASAEVSSSDLSPSQGENGKSMGSFSTTSQITTSTTHSTPTTTRSSPTTTATTIRPLLVPTFRPRVTHVRTYPSKHHHEHHWGPFFEEPLNATSGVLQVGIHVATEAVLNCRVGMLRDKTVMWVRKTTEKVSLLTVGNVTYSGDPRIAVKFQYPNNWRLHINPIQREDAGLYMCQVSTHPPRVFATNVTVLAPAIRVVDEHGHEVHDRYYKMGSAIDLTCQVAVSFLSVLPTVMPVPSPPHYSHQRQFPFIPKLANFNVTPLIMPKTSHTHHTMSNHSGASTTATFPHIPQLSNLRGHAFTGHRVDDARQLEFFHQKLTWRKDGGPIPKDVQLNLSAIDEWRNSRLSIPVADRRHSGEYSCSILNSSAAVVHVQVLNGEMPAAVQHNSATIRRSILSTLLLFLFFSPLVHISC